MYVLHHSQYDAVAEKDMVTPRSDLVRIKRIKQFYHVYGFEVSLYECFFENKLLHSLSSFPSVMFCILIVYRQYPSSRHVGGGLDREAIGPLSLCLLLLGIYWREEKIEL